MQLIDFSATLCDIQLATCIFIQFLAFCLKYFIYRRSTEVDLIFTICKILLFFSQLLFILMSVSVRINVFLLKKVEFSVSYMEAHMKLTKKLTLFDFTKKKLIFLFRMVFCSRFYLIKTILKITELIARKNSNCSAASSYLPRQKPTWSAAGTHI